MEIVVLDGYCLNHGDLDWKAFEALGDLRVYDRTPYAEIVSRMGSAEVMITNKCVIDRPLTEKLPHLKYIGVLATGYNNIDIRACHEKGITVTNVPAYSTESVVQSVFGLILELYIKIGSQSASAKGGDWAKAPDFCYYPEGLKELYGKTLGIIGYGAIGRRVKEVAKAFGMKVLVNTRTKRLPEDGFEYADRDRLFAESDIITLHCPLTEENKGMINAAAIEKMKRGAIVINTARGGLIVESDLAAAIESGRIAGAGVDVLDTEPARADDPLIAAKNTIVTPHTAWATAEARGRLMKQAADNLRAYLQGDPINVV